MFGAAGAVFHLDRQAKAFAHTAQALDAFSAALAQHLAVATAHHHGVEAAFAGHEIGVGEHRPAEALQLRLLAGAKVGKQQRHLRELQLQGGGAAVVAGGQELSGGHAQEFTYPLKHLLLQRVVELEVALQWPLHAFAGGQEGGVFARAVVLQGALAPFWCEALELFALQIRFPQDLERLAGLLRFPCMGGAGDGQGAVVVVAQVGSAAAHEHLGLERLERRADEAELLRVAGAHQHPAALVAHHRMHPVQ